MLKDPSRKYRAFPVVGLADRAWPNRTITAPPIWMSTDLRDGNQSLFEPMDARRKLRMFQMLCRIGFKQIEVAFPSASQTDFDFVRQLIEEDLIPQDVSIEVLTQAREDLIRRTFESLRGARRAIVHLYNATAPAFRRIVFDMSPADVRQLAVQSATLIRDLAVEQPETDWTFQYSPEVFSGTELEVARDVVDAVMDVWQPTPGRKAIVNLPATVEMSTPNIYADQIEWMHRKLKRRDSLIISVHPHNDRGTGTAAGEFALMAGADRLEGCLFGNGERTGNVCLVTLGLNLFTQGVDPGIDFSNINQMIRTVEHCNQLPVHPRHPYGGDLVFTAFSGSHQDAIKKGLAARAQEVARGNPVWDVPYLPIDPADVGRTYDAVIRVNSQSGKGGIAYLLERDHGLSLPRLLQIEFSQVIQRITDATGKELSSAEIRAAFDREYTATLPLTYVDHRAQHSASDGRVEHLTSRLQIDGVETVLNGAGNGPVDAFVQALRETLALDVHVQNYHEHATGGGEDATAVAYVQLRVGQDVAVYGVGLDPNIVTATLKAVVSAVNRAIGEGVLALPENARAVNA
jgi:2-isopropylmalate synthase